MPNTTLTQTPLCKLKYGVDVNYSPNALQNADFHRTNPHMQNFIKILYKMTLHYWSSLSMTPAIVRNASILNFLKFVFIC